MPAADADATPRGAPAWDFPDPHLVTVEVVAADIDAYNHVNNAVYLSWFDIVAWSHSTHLGISLEECVRIRRGMAAHRTEIDYQRAAVLGDRVEVGTWIVSTDGKLRVERRFQVKRVPGGHSNSSPNGETLARARTDYVCINLDSGRAARMPESFSRAYVTTVSVPQSGTG
jgi:acyl-CoA thioester hydrolase